MNQDFKSQVNDCVVDALGGQEDINGLLLTYYLTNGAASLDINDAEVEFLLASGGIGDDLNDLWFSFLTSIGYTGTLSGMYNQFWCEDRGIPSTPNTVTYNGSIVTSGGVPVTYTP